MEQIREAVKNDWSSREAADALKAFGTGERGLSRSEAETRFAAFGPNEIAQGKPTPWYVLLGRQFTNPLIYILLAAALVTGLVGHLSDVTIILFVLVVNAGIGYYQESKAERAINNIKGMSAPHCRVRRDGEVLDVTAVELVPGDLVLLEEGDRVPADGRLVSTKRLRIEEAIFTGETIAAEKQAAKIEVTAVLADKTNMIFMGTHVTAGRGEAVVTGTGMATELGKIAGLVQTADEVQTPLTRKLETFSSLIARGVLGICAVIFVSSYLVHKQSFTDVLLNAIALAVSAIPEGLPIVVTLVLAIGVRRMAQHNALIRKLPTVETLGSATVICTDKTGTLTRNQMVVTRVYTCDQEYEVTGEGYAADGTITAVKGEYAAAAMASFAETAVLCNNASLRQEPNGAWTMVGDGTEGALMTLAGKLDRSLLTLRERYPRQGELPFDSKIKYMVAVHGSRSGLKAHLKGSLEAVLARCTRIAGRTGERPLSETDRELILKKNLGYADEALRVLGFAVRGLPAGTDPTAFCEGEQEGYTFVGLVGMMDLPRPEAIEAVAKCRKAGIMVVMITGDHAATARAVGRKVGLFDDGMRMMTGEELSKLDEEGLRSIVESVAIYARTSPEDKMRIIKALQHHGHVVSMTGDGVNDAPALTRADIGVAMGRSGTDVAREAAGMVLVDDNFASIVSAVEEGRIIFNNLRKAIGFMISTNAGEVLTLLTASLMGWAAPLRAVQILWVNLVTDGFTTIALGVDPAEGDEMQKKPRRHNEPLLSGPMSVQVGVVAVLMTVGTLWAYSLGLNWNGAPATPEQSDAAVKLAQTMAFGVMVFFQLFNIFNCRSYEKSLFRVGIFGNMSLVGAVLLASLLQMAAMYLPFLQKLMNAASLDAAQMGVVLGISLSVIPVVEVTKFVARRESPQNVR
ncbi:MAG TPA: HAD-IC family P-type ATPase [Candidatus Ozemobacteraceae bacterium]|nr:HAD-IC family P-type ATPase [Candidatus Ozemobacteraceae bacterium]